MLSAYAAPPPFDGGYLDHRGNAWASVEAGTEGAAALALGHGLAWSTTGRLEASALWRGAEEWHFDEGLLFYRQAAELTLNSRTGAHPGGALVVEAHDGGWGSGALLGRLRWSSQRRGLELRLGPTVGLDATAAVAGGRITVEGRINLSPRLVLDGFLRSDLWAADLPLSDSSLALRIRAWPHPRWETSATTGGQLEADEVTVSPAAWGELGTTWWFHPLVGLCAHAGGALAANEDPVAWAFGGACFRGAASTAPPDHEPRPQRFSHWDPLATRVEVMGSFTGWEPVPLWRSSEGLWTGEFSLPSGASAYVYLVDGAILVPIDGDRIVADGFGGQSAVIDTP